MDAPSSLQPPGAVQDAADPQSTLLLLPPPSPEPPLLSDDEADTKPEAELTRGCLSSALAAALRHCWLGWLAVCYLCTTSYCVQLPQLWTELQAAQSKVDGGGLEWER